MENKIQLFVKKLNENAVIPTYAHFGDVGMDLTATDIEYDVEKDLYIYHTGLAFESDFNIADFVFLRSSNRKTDGYLCNQVGIVDCAIYRGEVLICMKNRDSLSTVSELEGIKSYLSALSMFSDTEPTFSLKDATEKALTAYKLTKEEYIERAKNLEFAPYKVGDKIAQMVCLKYPTVELIEKNELSDTERGTNGFGSTDKKNN